MQARPLLNSKRIYLMADKPKKTIEKKSGTVKVRCLTGSTVEGVVYECGEVYDVTPGEAETILGNRFELVKG